MNRKNRSIEEVLAQAQSVPGKIIGVRSNSVKHDVSSLCAELQSLLEKFQEYSKKSQINHEENGALFSAMQASLDNIGQVLEQIQVKLPKMTTVIGGKRRKKSAVNLVEFLSENLGKLKLSVAEIMTKSAEQLAAMALAAERRRVEANQECDEANKLFDEQDYAPAFKLYLSSSEKELGRAQVRLGYCYQHGLGVGVDSKLAIQWYERACYNGDVDGWQYLGEMHEMLEKYEEAIEYYQQGSDFGEPDCQINMGRLYEQNLIPVDSRAKTPEQVAQFWYSQAVKNGSARACNHLGLLLLNMGGDRQTEAFDLFKTAAAKGSVVAFNNMGVCHEEGTGVVQDLEQAKHCYRKAAEQGHVYAMCNLGALELLDENYDAAFSLFTEAAEQFSVEAVFELGLMHELGLGTPMNFAKAFSCYRRAAAEGNSKAQYKLGCCLQLGIGCDQDSVEAVKALNLAVEMGSSDALCKLGEIYEDEGELEAAFRNYNEAAKRNHPDSFAHVARFYEEGLGDVDADVAKARVLYTRGASLGSIPCIEGQARLQEVDRLRQLRLKLEKPDSSRDAQQHLSKLKQVHTKRLRGAEQQQQKWVSQQIQLSLQPTDTTATHTATAAPVSSVPPLSHMDNEVEDEALDSSELQDLDSLHLPATATLPVTVSDPLKVSRGPDGPPVFDRRSWDLGVGETSGELSERRRPPGLHTGSGGHTPGSPSPRTIPVLTSPSSRAASGVPRLEADLLAQNAGSTSLSSPQQTPERASRRRPPSLSDEITKSSPSSRAQMSQSPRISVMTSPSSRARVSNRSQEENEPPSRRNEERRPSLDESLRSPASKPPRPRKSPSGKLDDSPSLAVQQLDVIGLQSSENPQKKPTSRGSPHSDGVDGADFVDSKGSSKRRGRSETNRHEATKSNREARAATATETESRPHKTVDETDSAEHRSRSRNRRDADGSEAGSSARSKPRSRQDTSAAEPRAFSRTKREVDEADSSEARSKPRSRRDASSAEPMDSSESRSKSGRRRGENGDRTSSVSRSKQQSHRDIEVDDIESFDLG